MALPAPPDPSKNSDSKLGTNSIPEEASSGSKSVVPTPPSWDAAVLCLLWMPVNCAFSAITGSMFGYGAGLLKKKGFKGSFSEARSSAKAFAVMSGVDQLVGCLLARLRGKDDAFNAGIAGCASGLAVTFPGSPKDLLQHCVAFGALSFFMKGLDRQRPTLAHETTYYSKKKKPMLELSTCPSLLHLQLPLPNDLKEAFSSFCETLILKKPCSSKFSTPQ